MTLTDAIAALRATSDQTHKFWGYYQAVTAASVAFAWASNAPPTKLLVGLTAAFLVFAILNCRLVFSSQSAALETWNAIQAYKEDPPVPITPQFEKLLTLNKPDTPELIGALHLALSIAACLAILARI